MTDEDYRNRVFVKSCEDMSEIPDGSIHCVVTSPPYWMLRDYGTARWDGGHPDCDHATFRQRSTNPSAASAGGKMYDRRKGRMADAPAQVCPKCSAVRIDEQIGLEPTPSAFIERIVGVFREIRRVLRDDGVVWVNMGDGWAGAGKTTNTGTSGLEGGDETRTAALLGANKFGDGLKEKDLVGMPWMLAFALRADGWVLRSDVIWSKPNPMPESTTDRPSSAHEYVFLLAKSNRTTYWTHRDLPGTRVQPLPDYRWLDRANDNAETASPPAGWEKERFDDGGAQKPRWRRINLWRGHDYFYDGDAIREPLAESSVARLSQPNFTKQTGGAKDYAHGVNPNNSSRKAVANLQARFADTEGALGRNKRSVWTIATEAYTEAHFATFPRELPAICIRAGTSEAGCCAACGAPWERRTRSWYVRPPNHGSGSVVGRHPDEEGTEAGNGRKDNGNPRLDRRTATTGFAPTCRCDAGTVPCRVLDPFGGSGTTALVAESLGCDWVLYELNPEYAALIERRTAQRGLFTSR